MKKETLKLAIIIVALTLFLAAGFYIGHTVKAVDGYTSDSEIFNVKK